MRKQIAFIALILVLSMLVLSGCDFIGKNGGNPADRQHNFIEGKCSCGATDPDYEPPHTHSFTEGKCSCGATDPNYKPPHKHSFSEGRCTECGSYDPDYIPHEHSFTDGKCSCGETDPDYKPHEHSFTDGKCECGESDPDYKPEPEEPEVLDPIKIYLVGDSTASSFEDKYFYPRYGYGTQLGSYLNDEATVVNLALSGRSSKSFITEENYATLSAGIGEGDYLIIGFGHNDEKSDDSARFTDATKPYTDATSFGYYLYNYYIKLALDKGATPILCTPIVRAKSTGDYSGNEAHVTANGDYAQYIRDLGAELGVDVIDLTAITKAEYQSKGYETAKLYHAVLQGKYDTDGTTVVPNWTTIDTTHLNIYGAKFVAYSLAMELGKLDNVRWYVKKDAAAPTVADLMPLEGYKVPDYTTPNLDNYNPPEVFQTISDGWYGTAFGNTGGSPTGKGFIAKETEEGVFRVGNESAAGKFASADEGFAFLFRQVEASKNFTLTVTGKLITHGATNQTGFGIMLRDDCYINQPSGGSVSSNYVTAGFLCNSSNMGVNFYRENASLNKGSTNIDHAAVGDTFTATIERIGQAVNVTVVIGGKTYTASYVDFDFLAVDNGYMYVGMFANRGTVVEFTNVSFEITGESQGA